MHECMEVADYQRLKQKLLRLCGEAELIYQEKQARMLKLKVANRERSVVFT